MSFCANCGNQLDENVKFCPNCGQAVESVEPTPTPAPSEVKEEPPIGEAAPAPKEIPVRDAFNDPRAKAKTVSVNTKLTPKVIVLLIAAALALLLLLGVGVTCCSVMNSHTDTFIGNYGDSGDYDDYDNDDDYNDSNDYNEERFYGDFFELVIPDSWVGHYTAVEGADSVTFYNTENADAGYGGALVTVGLYQNVGDLENIPDYRVIAESPAGCVALIFPTDLQYDMSDATLSDLYQDMFDDVDDITGNMTVYN